MIVNPICHWAGAGVEVPLFNFDPGTTGPVDQRFLETTGEYTGLGMPAPGLILPLDEGSGNFVDRAGSCDLVPTAGIRHGQIGMGLSVSGDMAAKKTAEFDEASTDEAQSASSSDWDIDASTSVFFFGIMRVVTETENWTSRVIMRKQGADHTVGYVLQVQSAAGLTWEIADNAANEVSALTSWNMMGEGWVSFACWIDRRTDFMGVVSSNSAAATTDCSAVGSLSNGDYFGIGKNDTFGSFGGNLAYLAGWDGTDAEDMIDNYYAGSDYEKNYLWTHGDDPTGLLTQQTYGNDGNIWTLIGNGDNGLQVAAWQHHEGHAATWGLQFPIAWAPGLSSPTGLGVMSQTQRSTLVSESDNFANAGWVATNCTKNGLTPLNAPHGFRNAQSLVSPGGGGTCYIQNTIACAASTEYTFDVFHKRAVAEGSDVAGCSLEAYNLTTGATIANTAFTATTDWQRVVLTFTTPVGCASMGFRINVNTATVSRAIHAWRATAVAGKLSGPICYRAGAGINRSTAVELATIGFAAGTYIKGVQGEIEALYECWSDDSVVDRSIIGSDPAADRREFYIDTGQALVGDPRTGAGAWMAGLSSAGGIAHATERTVRWKWDSVAALPSGNHCEIYNNAVRVSNTAAGWAAGSGATQLGIGCDRAGVAFQLDGILEYLKVWENPQLP